MHAACCGLSALVAALLLPSSADRAEDVSTIALRDIREHRQSSAEDTRRLESREGCESWCHEEAEDEQLKDEHCEGDLISLCGECSYCTEASGCAEFCSAETQSESEKARNCKGDLQDLCGSCSYCEGFQLGKKEEGALHVVSVGLMAWCTQGFCNGSRLANIAAAIKQHQPAILGTQQHRDKNVLYDDVRRNLEGEGHTGLTHQGFGIYYDPAWVEPVGELLAVPVHPPHRNVSGQIYKMKQGKSAGQEFAFFNTEWAYQGQEAQADIVINFMKTASKGRPMILVGGFEVWESNHALERLTQELDLDFSTPQSATRCERGAVDYVLASKSKWRISGPMIDKEECDITCDYSTCATKRSDHSLLSVGMVLT